MPAYEACRAAGDAIPNTMLPYNEEHSIQLGTFKEEGGTRIVLKAGGKTIIDYLDTAAEALSEPGYFGLMARTGSITLKESEMTSSVAAIAVTELTDMLAGGIKQAVVRVMDANGSESVIAAKDVKFRSSKPSVASVDAHGRVRAHRAGTAVITAEYRGKIGRYELAVERK